MRFVRQRAFWTAAVLILAAGSAAAGTIEGRVQTHDPKLDLAGFVVYVDDVEGPFPAPERVVVMDQHGLLFQPHVLVVQVGTTVEFLNTMVTR